MAEAERHRLERMFHELDANNDGRVDPKELAEGVKKMGYYHVTEEQIIEFMKKSDVTKSGDLNMDEFLTYLQEHEKQLKIIFSSLDENQDGVISATEIVSAFQKLGIVITENEARALMQRINVKDQSLDISFEEWRDYLLFHPSADLAGIISSWRHNTLLLLITLSQISEFAAKRPDSATLNHFDHLVPSMECMDMGEDVGVPDDFSEQDLYSGMWWRHLVAGGSAGMVSRTCTAPLDRLKIMLQVHGTGRYKSGKSLRIKDAFTYMLREGGVRGLWRGNGINVIKIAPESAVKFAAYDFFKRGIRGSADRDLMIYERFLAGSMAGGVSQSVIYPMEVMKTRLALRKTNEFTGIIDCAKQLYQTGGLRVFYRGYIPNLLGILPYAGIDLAVYETLKQKYLSRYGANGDNVPPAITLLACGTFSSCCGQVAAYPLALVRTKLQSQAGLNLQLPKEQTHAIGLFKYILREEGVRGLYRGILPNFCKVAPAVSISYYVYERTRQHLGVEMV